jgi:hypothetical protein
MFSFAEFWEQRADAPDCGQTTAPVSMSTAPSQGENCESNHDLLLTLALACAAADYPEAQISKICAALVWLKLSDDVDSGWRHSLHALQEFASLFGSSLSCIGNIVSTPGSPPPDRHSCQASWSSPERRL